MREKHKVYVLVIMVGIAALVAYYRFYRSTDEPSPAARPAGEVSDLASIFDSQMLSKANQPGYQTAQPTQVAIIRDLFAPVGPLPEAPPAKTAIAQKQSHETLKLHGTVIGSNSAMAIINNRFVHQGQVIAGYRIEKIAPDRVYLVSGKNRKVLEVMTRDKVNQ